MNLETELQSFLNWLLEEYKPQGERLSLIWWEQEYYMGSGDIPHHVARTYDEIVADYLSHLGIQS